MDNKNAVLQFDQLTILTPFSVLLEDPLVVAGDLGQQLAEAMGVHYVVQQSTNEVRVQIDDPQISSCVGHWHLRHESENTRIRYAFSVSGRPALRVETDNENLKTALIALGAQENPEDVSPHLPPDELYQYLIERDMIEDFLESMIRRKEKEGLLSPQMMRSVVND